MNRVDVNGEGVRDRPRLRAVVGLAAALVLAIPGVARAQTVGQDSVVGTGTTDPSAGLTTAFALDAPSGPSGENPSGTIGFDEGNGLLAAGGGVTCLSVIGNTATIGYAGNASVDHGTFMLPIVGFIKVVDGGPGGSQDRFAEVGATPIGSPPRDCSLAPSTTQFLPLVLGDIAVHDGLPPPTSKEQCNGGGFTDFGFKNQGQCVAFVNRGAQT